MRDYRTLTQIANKLDIKEHPIFKLFEKTNQNFSDCLDIRSFVCPLQYNKPIRQLGYETTITKFIPIKKAASINSDANIKDLVRACLDEAFDYAFSVYANNGVTFVSDDLFFDVDFRVEEPDFILEYGLIEHLDRAIGMPFYAYQDDDNLVVEMRILPMAIEKDKKRG